MKSLIIANIIITSVVAICVTAASCYFDKPVILWWYALLPLIQYDIETKRGDNDG